jgi:pimeloyl-ACP methyl ester carboxylesterase
VARLKARAALAVAALIALAGPGAAQDKGGVVFLHGKLAMPNQPATAALIGALGEAGYAVETPEMCWSARRRYDRAYLDCLAEIDDAIARDRARGAARIVLGGLDLGANAAIGYAARHDGIAAILALSPSHSPERLAGEPAIEASLATARAMAERGALDGTAEFADLRLGAREPELAIRVSARIYLSWFAPDSPSLMPLAMPRVAAPILWLCASDDPNQHGIDYAYSRAPKNPLNRYVTLDSDQIQLPLLGIDEVLAWLKEVRKASDAPKAD